MLKTSKTHQRGLSLYAMVVYMAIFGSLALIGFRAVPMWNEYATVQRMVSTLSKSDATESPASIREAFDKRASIEYVTSITGSDLSIRRSADGFDIKFAYERIIPLAGNASLVFAFAN